MPRIHHANDANFGKRKVFGGQVDIQNPARADFKKESEFTSGPHYMKGMKDDPYQGAYDLLPKPDYYSNPVPHENSKGWPTLNMQKQEMSQERMILMISGLSLLVIIFLKLSD